ncbi:hypothetical protein SAMN04488550_2918 [Gordonia malaquae]|uniref:Uncharacterized protein n=1 Tax=Gordonia malaquae NBRC 108250 TaxID=1223542 RepID=M3UHF7_GORML|nr:hypothetical protein [Gordonia malaquae]GAC78790.1 hypothetical protein GM1_004_02350 [Gordonia malaquae NBRC 108250]SED66286.1 hypothetical protein SAMN04488550_2918 [Gordonia malaquae]
MPENGSAQRPVDYYASLGLDSRAPSHALLAQLSHRISQTTIGPERHLMEQARAILGDVGKKQVYDQRLTNPHAKPWTPDELHELARAQPGRPAASGLGAQLAAIPRRVLAAVAGGLAVLLVLVITVASCTGGSADTTVAGDDTNRSNSGEAGDSNAGKCWRVDNTDLPSAAFKDKSDRKWQPRWVVMLTEAYDLPSSFAGMATTDWSGGRVSAVFSTPYEGLTQFQDKNVGVAWPGVSRENDILAVVDPSGKVVAEYSEADASRAPKQFSLAKPQSSGFYRVEARDGLSIPQAANGTETNMNFASAILPDAFDKSLLWVMMRGSAKLYKANLYLFADSVPLGQGADVSGCGVME